MPLATQMPLESPERLRIEKDFILPLPPLPAAILAQALDSLSDSHHSLYKKTTTALESPVRERVEPASSENACTVL